MDTTSDNLQKLKDFALVLNFLAIHEYYDYVSNEGYFIRDAMKSALEDGIISEDISRNKCWSELNINILDHDRVEETTGPRILEYGPPKKSYWSFKFKRIVLPDKWKLIGCVCGRNMSSGAFAIMDNDKIVKVLQYFPNYDPESKTHYLESI